MTHNVQLSESLNERGNRSYTSNFVFPKTSDQSTNNLYVVCATVGPGVMYRGEQVAEQVVNEFVKYINENSPQTHAEADAQAEMIAHALMHTEAQLSEYNVLHPECHGITATLACIHFTENGAIVGWVGDTRAVLIRGGMLIKQTVDHSVKYPYDDFSMHPRRNVNRVIEGADKPASIDVEWWNDLQPNDIIVLGTYAVTRPLEQGFLGDAWERDEMRHAIKLACDAHARDNYAITTIRMGEASAATNMAGAGMAFAAAAPVLAIANEVVNVEEPTLESETAPLESADEPTFESETAPLESADEPTLESETAPLEPTMDSEDTIETDEAATVVEPAFEEEVVAETEVVNEEEEFAIEEETAIEEPEVVAETPTEVVVETPAATPIVGNYTYDDEEEGTTGGIAWIPTSTKPITETVTPVTNVVTNTTTNVMDNITNTTTNTVDAAKDATTSIVDFTPISGNPKPATASSGGFSGGWLIAAAMLFVGLAVWLGSSWAGQGVDNKLSDSLMQNMTTELDAAETPADKLAIYAKYQEDATGKYKGKISETALATIESGINQTNEAMSQPDATAGDLNGTAIADNSTAATTAAAAKTTASDAATTAAADAVKTAADAAAKETATEAGAKTKTAIASAAMPVVPVTESGALGNKPKGGIAKAKTADAPQARMAKPAAGAKVVGGVNTAKPDVWKTFDKAWAESEGFRVVSKGGKWGWSKADGTPLTAPIFEECGSFHNGMAAVKKGGKWGFANTSAKLVVDCKYKSVTAFGAKCPGLAQANDGKKILFIDATGKEAKGCQ